MISIINAKEIIKKNTRKSEFEYCPISNSLWCITAENVVATHNSPDFNQSAMDGYALFSNSLNVGDVFNLRGESSAGKVSNISVEQGFAMPIYTGAKVPEGANMVVPIENVRVDAEYIVIMKTVTIGANIRVIGSQFSLNELLINKGTKIDIAEISLLAMNGIKNVLVAKEPVVNLIVTGNELIEPGNELPSGGVYESNSFMLKAALNKYGINNIIVNHLKDDFSLIKQGIDDASKKCNYLVLSGGISVGKYDYVHKALTDLGVKGLFYKVAQKPGKPLFVGVLNNSLVFALPGNPGAALTCFYEYLLPSLDIFRGKTKTGLNSGKAILTSNYSKGNTLTHFLKGYYNEGKVRITENQESFKITAFSEANCLIYLPQEIAEFIAGDVVEVHFF